MLAEFPLRLKAIANSTELQSDQEDLFITVLKVTALAFGGDTQARQKPAYSSQSQGMSATTQHSQHRSQHTSRTRRKALQHHHRSTTSDHTIDRTTVLFHRRLASEETQTNESIHGTPGKTVRARTMRQVAPENCNGCLMDTYP